MLGILTGVLVIAGARQGGSGNVEGLLVRRDESKTRWAIFDQAEVGSGVTIPADTNVTFHLPANAPRISRDVLLGQKGQDVRYWGYCFRQNYEDDITDRRKGLRGLVFLSDKEQQVQKGLLDEQVTRFSLSRLPKDKEELKAAAPDRGLIKPQINVFEGGMLCYIQTETPLALALDPDGDRLNDKLERDIGTNPQISDSDADGLSDSAEFFGKTDPLRRDTDADNVIDGIEDADWNGRIDLDETDPRKKDTDNDGLCDGFCRFRVRRGLELFAGEDRNLNGKLDAGESNPTKIDSDKDGLTDYQEFLNCLSSTAQSC